MEQFRNYKIFKPIVSKGKTYVFSMNLNDYFQQNSGYWCALPGKRGMMYLRVPGGLFHRKILGAKKGEFVDHINRNTFDNTRDNLRIATVSENNRNTTPRGKYKGIMYNKANKNWRVRIHLNGKISEIGSFKKEEDAVKAWNDSVKNFHGDFSYYNTYKGEL